MPLLLALLLLLPGCGREPPLVHETRYMMGTLVEFTVYGVPRARAERAIAAAAREMRRIDELFAAQRPSPVARFNEGSGALPAEAGRLLALAERIRRGSGGAFHPALGRLIRLWGFADGRVPRRLPDSGAIRRLLPPARCVGRDAEGGWRLLDPRCSLDFGGIAKGYAIDRGIAALRAHGVSDAIIDAGGDLRVIGRRGRRPWRIGVRDPRRPGRVRAVLALAGDVSVVTSGDYERFAILGGRRYHHILDPATGWPARRAMSATVISTAGAAPADGWSTALFVLGPAGLARVERAGMAGMVIDAEGRARLSPSFSRWLADGARPR